MNLFKLKLLKNPKRRRFEQTRIPVNCCNIAIYRQKECDCRRALSLGGPRLPRENNATTGEAADAKEQATDFKIRRRWTTPKKKPKVHVKVPRIQTFHVFLLFFWGFSLNICRPGAKKRFKFCHFCVESSLLTDCCNNSSGTDVFKNSNYVLHFLIF